MSAYCESYPTSYPAAHPCDDAPASTSSDCVYSVYTAAYPTVHPCDTEPPAPADPGVECGSELQLTRGDDYTGDRARSFFFESDTAPAATDVATMTWRDPYCDEVIGSVTTSSFSDAGEGRYCANFNLVNFAADNRPGQWPFDIEIDIDGADTRTIANGILDLIADQTR